MLWAAGVGTALPGLINSATCGVQEVIFNSSVLKNEWFPWLRVNTP
jgi:hypothetical protein